MNDTKKHIGLMSVLLFMSETVTSYVALTEHTYQISDESIEKALRGSISRVLNIYEDEAWVNLYEVERPVDGELRIRGGRLETDRNPEVDYEIVRQSGANVSFEELDDINNGNYNMDSEIDSDGRTMKSTLSEFINENFDF